MSDAAKAVVGCPAGWEWVRDLDLGGVMTSGFRSANGLTVLVSIERHASGEYRHVSLSRRSRMPTYDDVKWVKQLFIGDEHAAYQVFPRAAEHVNLHNFALHLWQPLFPNCLDELPVGP